MYKRQLRASPHGGPIERNKLYLELLDLAGLALDVLADLSEDLLEVLVHLQQTSNLVGMRAAASRYSEDAALALRQVHLPQRQHGKTTNDIGKRKKKKTTTW